MAFASLARSTLNYNNNLRIGYGTLGIGCDPSTPTYYPTFWVSGSTCLYQDYNLAPFSGNFGVSLAPTSICALPYNTDEIWGTWGRNFMVSRTSSSIDVHPTFVSTSFNDANRTFQGYSEGLSWSSSLWLPASYIGTPYCHVWRHSGSVSTAWAAYGITASLTANFGHLATSSIVDSGDPAYPSKLYVLVEGAVGGSTHIYALDGTINAFLDVFQIPGVDSKPASATTLGGRGQMIEYSGSLYISTSTSGSARMYMTSSITGSFLGALPGAVISMEVFPSGGLDRLWCSVGSTVYVTNAEPSASTTWTSKYATGQTNVYALRAYNNRLYAMTGNSGYVYEYNPVTDAWKTCGQHSSQNIVYGAGVCFDKLYVFGDSGASTNRQYIDILYTTPTTIFTVSGNVEITGSMVSLNVPKMTFIGGNQTIMITPKIMETVKTITNTYTASIYDTNIIANTTAGAYGLLLYPALSGSSNGLMLRIKLSGSNALTISTSGSDVIETSNSSSLVLNSGSSMLPGETGLPAVQLIPSSSYWYLF